MTSGEKEEFMAYILDEILPAIDTIERPSTKAGLRDEWEDLSEAVNAFLAAAKEVL